MSKRMDGRKEGKKVREKKGKDRERVGRGKEKREGKGEERKKLHQIQLRSTSPKASTEGSSVLSCLQASGTVPDHRLYKGQQTAAHEPDLARGLSI